ncbi:MAG: DUF4251 domain-containing protein [Prevotella sp.]|nr:DUF4251 domain-containing protein [Prevotella sp.]
MKKYLISMACVLLTTMVLNGCATSKEKAARKTEQTAKVKAALAERHYKIVVNSMADPSEPDEKRSPQLLSTYRLEVRNDSLITFLPHYGYNQILGEAGVGTRGLILYEPISSYQEELTKKGKRHIEISVENDNDTLIFVIEVSAKGHSNISVRSRRRERISYAGQMEFSI